MPTSILGGLDPAELVILVVGLASLIPVAMYYRDVPTWCVVAYGCLLIGAVTTNLEHLLWPGRLHLIEHSIGYFGAGVASGVGAYIHRRRVAQSSQSDSSLEDP